MSASHSLGTVADSPAFSLGEFPMPVFPKPTVRYSYDVAAERQRLRAHKADRTVPDKAADALLLRRRQQTTPCGLPGRYIEPSPRIAR